MREATAQAKTIFLEALERLGRTDMLRYLDQACGDDVALRTRVEELLNAHEDAGSFLEARRPNLDATVDDPHVVERPGVVIGPYKLMEQIGEGGMGLVFVAEQLHPVRRKVALKLIKPGMDTREVIARFEAERQALALMDHPNIAHVFDAGATDSGRPYFVMELVRGVGITEFCDQNRLSPRERLELFVHVCQAVQHAHHKGIIHRDLKSTNILVTLHDGTPVVKVIDFGVAKAIGQQLTEKTIYTGFAQLIGTPMYMSPEQAEMSGLDIDTRSDIYALGVLLYELLTGAMPFDKERLRTAGFDEIRRIIREEEPPRPSTRFSTLGQATATLCANRRSEPARLSQLFRGELDWIVMKALEKDRNRRYESASAFAADVLRYLHDEPVLACPPTLGYRLRKIVRRHRRAALAIASILLVLLCGIVGTTWGLLRATVEANRKDVALAAAQASERNAKDNLWLSLYEQARARRFSRQMGQRLDSLDALAQAAALRPDDRLRDAAIAAMALPDVRPGATWTPWADGHQTRAWAFDGQYRLYAHVSDEATISVRTLPDDREIQSIDGGSTQVVLLWFSPDGRYLAAIDAQYTLQWWSLADGKAVLPEVLRQTFGWAFSPDSRQLVVGRQGWLLRFDVATGRELNRWQLPAGRRPHMLVYHPDNNQLAVGYKQATVASVHNATTGKLLVDLPVGGMTEAAVAWDRDGRRLAVTGAEVNPVIQIWDVPALRKLASLEGHVQRIPYVRFHPDGDLLASASWDGVVRLWHPGTGQQLMQLPLSMLPQFSSDGRVLGVARHGNKAQVLEVSATREYRTLVSSLGAGQGGYNHDSDVSPDGQLFAHRMNDAVRLWHLPSGRELAVLPPGSPLFQSARELLIANAGGLQRWPLQPGAAHELRVGPPCILPLPAVPMRAALSQDRRTLALVSESSGGGLLVDLAPHFVRTARLQHQNAAFVALSPDGLWMASSGWHSDRVRLWNTATGTLVHEWITGMARVFFTPDSRELIVCRAEEFTFYDTKTLKQARRIRRDVALYPGHVAYSPDGTLVALEMAPGIVHLQDAASGRTVARLEDPHGDRAGWMSFTAEGTQLVVTAPYSRAVHVWDLRAIRQRLKTMNLDWDWPEFRAAPSPGKAARPPRVEVLLGR